MTRNESGDFTLHFSFYCASVQGYMLLLFSSLICFKLKGMSAEGKIHILPEHLFGCTDIKIMTNTHFFII